MALVGGAVLLRLTHLDRGFTSDEVSLLFRGNLENLFNSNLTSVNPPGHRLLLGWLGGGLDALQQGRLLSFVCGLIALPAVYLTARRLAGNRLIGLVAATLVCTAPVAVETSVMTRSYAPWLAVCTWHVWSTCHWMEPDRVSPRVSGSVLAVTALLLPQIHYFSVPVLLVEGLFLMALSQKRLLTLGLYVPGALGFLVWLGPILEGTGNRLAPDHGGWGRALERTVALEGTTLPLILFSLLVAGLWLGRKAQKAISAGFLGVLFGCWLFGREHYFTPHAQTFSLPFLPILFASAFGWRPPFRRDNIFRGVYAAILLACMSAWALDMASRAPSKLERIAEPQGRDFVAGFSERWAEWMPPDGPHDIVISPRYMMQCLLLYERDLLLGQLRSEGPCEGERRCFVSDEQRFIGRPFDELPLDRPILVLYANRHPPRELPAGCTLWEPEEGAVPMYRCTPVETPSPDPPMPLGHKK